MPQEPLALWVGPLSEEGQHCRPGKPQCLWLDWPVPCGRLGLFGDRLFRQGFYGCDGHCHGSFLSLGLLCLPSANPVPLLFRGLQPTLVRKP